MRPKGLFNCHTTTPTQAQATVSLHDWLRDESTCFNERDLRFLLTTMLGENFSAVYRQDTLLDDSILSRLRQVARKYRQGIPLAYLLGKEEFFGLEFKINESCLIPRKETEHIVEKAMEIIVQEGLSEVLDLCCGCGTIAVCIKKTMPQLHMCASDISQAALDVARANAHAWGLDIEFVHCDLVDGLLGRSFELITVNPPYVEDAAIGESLRHEPREALSGGVDGLEIIRRLVERAPCILRSNGYIVMEIGAFQKDALQRMLAKQKNLGVKEWCKDYAGHWRGVVLVKH